MAERKLSCIYSPKLDRFFITAKVKPPHVEVIIKSKASASFEYFRYIPDIGISQKNINGYLEKNPREICFEITKNCNLSCRVCIANSSIQPDKNLRPEVFRKILKDKAENVDRITITGGEPTLSPSLFEILSIANTSSKTIILSTNGYIPKKIEAATTLVNNLIIALSLHGTEDVHDNFVGQKGAFRKTIESIKIATDNAKTVQIFTTITQKTLGCLPQLCDLLSAFPISEQRLNLVKPRGRRFEPSITYKETLSIVKNINAPYRITIKRRDQPFLFVNWQGRKELRHEQRYRKGYV